MRDLSVKNFKAHDCHVMLTVFLPIAIRAIKPEFLKMAITACATSFRRSHRRRLASKSCVTYMNLWWRHKMNWRYVYLLLFFNIMPHLMIHMVHQIQALGPCYLHEMWSYERFMSVLSRYVHNRAYPKGSMIEGYSTEEVVECCQEYLKIQKGIGKPDSCHKS